MTRHRACREPVIVRLSQMRYSGDFLTVRCSAPGSLEEKSNDYLARDDRRPIRL